jgi:hydroxyacylglutathione hydrolase
MKVKQIPVNPFNMNCYIYYDEISREGILIDPAAFTLDEKNYIKDFIRENEINIKYIVNTHGHLDHILGNEFAKSEFNVPLILHKDDMFLIENAQQQAQLFGLEIPASPPIDDFITEDSKIKIGDTELKFIHTPGHSPGSVCIIDKKNKKVFCGDLIFKNSVGRTDLAGGDMHVLLNSIKNILIPECEDDFILYPGHMEITTISEEKKWNPFLK